MENIPDETFATGVLGKGVGVQPETGVVCAPFAGKVTQVAETGHALGLESADGLELLIHVGVDTVDMNGKGFTPKVKVGDAVYPGQELLAFDRAAIKKAGHPDIVVVMLTNADDFGTVECASADEAVLGTQIISAKK
ncbi:MAG: PTS glucose transporter subunit IIA [Synergistaceae bacterium]|nr:PTS glucose transporter subunit IIA [Synergistaceae bacterium]